MQVQPFEIQPHFQPHIKRPIPMKVTSQGAQPLSDTDYKTYCYVILRDLMIAGGFLMGCASFFLIAVNPLFVLGVVPAVAFAVLGIMLGPTSANAAHGTPPRSYVPGQPLGLYNTSNNCWLNSSLQLIFNLDCLSTLVSKESPPFYFGFLQTAMKAYKKAQHQEDTDDHTYWLDKNTLNSQTVREKLYNAMQLEDCWRGQLESREHFKQEDPIAVFNYLLTAARTTLPLKHETHNFRSDSDEALDVVDAPAPDQACFVVQPGSAFSNFDEAWAAYFSSRTSNGSAAGAERTYAVMKKTLESAPPFFVMHLMRENAVAPDSAAMEKARQAIVSARAAGTAERDLPQMPQWREEKNRADFDVPHTLQLTEEQCPSEQAGYRCTGFISHWGATNGAGHYVSCVEKEGRFWFLNDQQYPVELTEEEYEQRMKQGSVFIYEKTSKGTEHSPR